MPLFKRTLSEFLFRRFRSQTLRIESVGGPAVGCKRDTLEYVKANMADAPYFEKHPKLVRYVVEAANLPGLYLEFGVGRGKSIRWIGSHADRTVHGFDSFDGIPEYWNGNPVAHSRKNSCQKYPTT